MTTDVLAEQHREPIVAGTLKLRCSSLPRLAACAPALDPPAMRIEGDREPSDLGTAFHAMIAAVINGSPSALSEESFAETAAHHNVDEDDLRPLVYWAAKAWSEQLAPHYPNAETERHMHADDPDAGVSLDGHLDVSGYDDPSREVRILDWKSGFTDGDYRDQLKGYAMLALLEFPDATAARVSKVQVREQRIDTWVFTRAELNGWWMWLTQHLRDRNTYRPGPHCGYCPRALTCEARMTALRQAYGWAVMLTEGPESLAVAMTEVVDGLRAVKKAAEAALDAIRADVIAHGGKHGPLSISESNRRKIRMDRAHEVLVEELGMERLIPLLKVTNKAVEEAAKEAAPRGQKRKVVAALWDRLGQAGAVEIEVTKTLEVDYGTRDNAAIESTAGQAGGTGDPRAIG